jgi:tetrahydromethanopterin S-methyltransferase subunit G
VADESLKLGVDVDEASLNRAKKRLEDIEKAQTDLRNSFLRGEKDADAFGKELGNLEKEARSLNKALDALEQPREIDVKTDRFDRTSRDVALAGDFASGSSQVGQGAEDLGLKGAGKAGAIGTAVGDLVEGVPRLVESAKALPQTFSAAAQAMGTSKIALGALAGGLVGLGIALQLATAQAEKQRKAAQEQLDAQRQASEFAATATREELQVELDAARRRQQLAQENAQLAVEQQAEARRQLTEATSAETTQVAELAARLHLGAGEFEALRQNVEATKNTSAAAGVEVRSLEQALASGVTAANDAAEAERQLAAERTQGILNEAAQAGELEATRLRLTDATREQIDTELQGLEVRKASLEAELASLQASGDTSEEVQNRIKQLTESIDFLGEQATQLEGLRSSAKTDKQVEAEKKLAAAREETSRASDKASQSETSSRRESRQRVSSGKTIGGMFTGGAARDAAGDSDKNAVDDARQKQQEIEQQYQDSLLEAQTDFNREREKEARRAEFELVKIGREAKRAEEDATRERNFAAAADVRENAADQKQDLKDQLKFEQREREIAYRHQQDDLRRTQQNQLRDLQNSLQQRGQMEATFMQNSVNVWQQYFQRLAGMQSKAAGGSGSAQSTGGNQSLSMNSLSYIQG